jgi:signal transduction histidine kinase
LIEDLLLLAEGGADAALSQQPVDLDDIVTDEIHRARAHAPDIEIDARHVSAAQVDGNPDHLRRVVRNLLDNACRHARSTVAVEVVERAGAAVLAVSDDGPGVPPELVPRLFERFSRLDEARSGSGGTGLGLSIVHDIVRRHGGDVSMRPAPGGGSSFVVTLPLSSAAR